MLAKLAEWAAPARVSGAYPGLWLRPDVYATHGHYLDCHLTIPTMERLGIGMTARALRRPSEEFAEVGDYEAVTSPVFAWVDAVARQAPTGSTLNGQTTVRAWQALAGERNGNGKASRARCCACARSWARSRSQSPRSTAPGLGSFNADISTDELRRAGLRAMGEVAARLDGRGLSRDLRPHPSRGAAASRRGRRVARAGRRSADQRGLLDL